MLTISNPNDGGGDSWRLAPSAHLPTEDPQEPENPHKPPPAVPADEPPPIPQGDPPSEAPPERANR
jgi:hypothetical protein